MRRDATAQGRPIRPIFCERRTTGSGSFEIRSQFAIRPGAIPGECGSHRILPKFAPGTTLHHITINERGGQSIQYQPIEPLVQLLYLCVQLNPIDRPGGHCGTCKITLGNEPLTISPYSLFDWHLITIVVCSHSFQPLGTKILCG